MPKDVTSCVVLGNGHSRKGYILNQMRQRCIVIGCNALYRDFSPDALVVGDPGLICEVHDSGYMKNHIVYVREQEYFARCTKGASIIPDDPKWSTGTTAVWVTCQMYKPRDLYLVGHDFIGGSVYEGTANYKHPPTKTGSETVHLGWIRQLGQCFKKFTGVTFFHVLDNEVYDPRDHPFWNNSPNLIIISKAQFKSRMRLT